MPRSQWDHCHKCKAEVCITDFETTWSEFQKASQTSTGQDKAKLRILSFKTTESEFQKPNENAAE